MSKRECTRAKFMFWFLLLIHVLFKFDRTSLFFLFFNFFSTNRYELTKYLSILEIFTRVKK